MFKLCNNVPFNYRFSDPICERYYRGNLGIFLYLTFEQDKLLYNIDVNVVNFIGKITNHVQVTILDGKSCRTVGKANGAWTRILGDKELPYNKHGGLLSKYVIYFISFYDPIKDIQKFCLLKFPADTYTGNNTKGSGFDHVNCYLSIAELPIDITRTTDTRELIIMAKNTTKSAAAVSLNTSEIKGIVKMLVTKNSKGEKVTKKGHYSFYMTLGKDDVISGRFSKEGAYDCKRGIGDTAVDLKPEMIEASKMADNAFGLIFQEKVGIAITKWDEGKSIEFTYGDKTFKGFPADGQLITVSVVLPKPAAAPAADGTVKRGPGRPRKDPAPVVVDDDEEEVVASDDDEEVTASGDDDEEVAASDDDEEEVAASGDDDEEVAASDDDEEEAGDEAAGDADDEEVATSDDDEEEVAAEEEEEPPTGPAFDDLVKKFKKDTKAQVKDKAGNMVPASCIVYFDGDGGVDKIKVKSVDAKNKSIEVYIFSTKEKATVAEGSAEWRCILLDKPETAE